jgi:translocation and assembly module TamB
MHAEVRDFGPLYAFLPSLGEITGEARADLDIAGTVSDPAITGQARVRGGSVDVVPLGIRLQEIEITATGRGRGGLDVEGSLRSGTGVLSVTGRLPVAPTPEDPGTLRLNGTRVHAVGLPEVSAWVSPDLEIVAVPDVIRVSGTVTLPVATIEVTEVPTTAARTSRDVVFVDDTTEVASGPGALQFQVRVVVGDSVTFRGFGFSARPEGAVLASQGAGGTIIGTGDVNLRDGRYFAYGQELQIERGRILFGGGPIDNPGLDVRASRTASDGTIAGLLIRGTLEDPLVTTFSEPAMSESEALSYIVLGGPLDQDSGDRSQVGAAATALGLQRGNQIAGRWGRSLGLDEMRVEAGATLEEASLVAGTYLSPKLYVSYGVGLFEPISTFRLRYFLSRRWSIRAETGAENGADLLFRIERGR